MKSKFVTEITYILLISITFCNYIFASGSIPLSVIPYQIKFNYEDGNIDDAITIQKRLFNGDYIPVPSPEWFIWNEELGNTNEMFAYVKAQSSRKIMVQFDGYCDNYQLLINLTVTSGSGIGEVHNYFICDYDNYNKDWITLELEGSTPPSIGIKEFTWEWKIFAIPLNTTSYCAGWETTSTTHEYYNLYDTPLEPCEVPKIFMLDYVCEWADGNTTTDGICSDILENGFKKYYKWTENGNCYRLASDYVRFLFSIGVDAVMHRWSSIFDPTYQDDMVMQRTRLIDPVPVGIYPEKDSIDWYWHQWVEAASNQRDPSAGISYPGNWGNYEDYLFMRYEMLDHSSPTNPWPYNQPGQSIGCEDPDHREYTHGEELLLWDFLGPNN